MAHKENSDTHPEKEQPQASLSNENSLQLAVSALSKLHKSRSEKLLERLHVIFTGCMVVVTVSLAVFAYKQWHASTEQAEAAKKQAAAANEQVKAANEQVKVAKGQVELMQTMNNETKALTQETIKYAKEQVEASRLSAEAAKSSADAAERTAQTSIRPEVVVSDWQYSFKEGFGNLKSITIVNVGRGPAMHIRAEMTGEPKTGATFGVSSYHVPIVPQGEQKILDFTGVIDFGDAATLGYGIKFRFVLITIACRDIDGHEYTILYKLMATNADYPEWTGFDKLVPGLYLVTRKVQS